MITKKWGVPEIDLFTSRACHQILIYATYIIDPQGQAIDVHQQSWKNSGLLYDFTSFPIILRVREERLTMILTTKNWPAI